MTYYLIDDQGRELGGAEMTLAGLLEDVNDLVVIPTKDLTMAAIENPELIIFGNICDVRSQEVSQALQQIVSYSEFVKIEFDYGFIPYRGEIPYKCYVGQDYPGPEATHQEMARFYKDMRERAVGIFFMSKEQMKIHDKYLGKGLSPCHVLSSCFSNHSLDRMEEIRNRDQAREGWIIVNGCDRWQEWCKGVNNAVSQATDDGVNYKVVETDTNDELLELFGSSEGMYMLPNIHDTCPRTAIEARLCGANIVVNENVQHGKEIWFNQSVEEIHEYLKGRKDFFWSKL